MGCNSSSATKSDNPTTISKVPANQKADVIVLLGAPGIGKTTQAQKLVNTNGFFHVSPEELLKQEIGRGSQVGKEIAEHQHSKRAVPASTIAQLVATRLKEISVKSPHATVILENFPNSKEQQAQWNEKQLAHVCNLKHVLYLATTEEHALPRLLLHPLIKAEPQDNREALAREQIKNHIESVKPVLDQHQAKLLRIEAAGNVLGVFVSIQRALLAAKVIKLTPEQKPDIIFVLGGPGSGKGTQCAKIKEKFKVHHYSTGDLLRDELKKDTPDSRKLKEIMDQGKLVPSDSLVKLLKAKIEEVGLSSKSKQSILLDGFPRGQDNIDSWKRQNLAEVCEDKILLYFECSDETMFSRMSERAKTSGRSDDNPETMKKRLETFHKETLPAVAHYEKLNKVQKINAEKGATDVFADVETHLIPKVRFAFNKRPNIIFVFGGPGAGKGTQCQNLSNKYGFIHFSTKKLVNEEAKKEGELATKIKQLQDQKKPVSDALIVDVIRKNIIQKYSDQTGARLGFIIDGYPKNLANIDAWVKADLDLVCRVKTLLNIDATEEVLFQRIKKKPSKQEKSLTDEEIRMRIADYQKSIAPVVKHYEKLGLLTSVDAEGSSKQNFEEIEDLLRKLKCIPK